MSSSTVISAWKEVFSRRKYWMVLAGAALLFYILNALITSWRTIVSVISELGISTGSIVVFNILAGFWKVMPVSSAVTLILISILTGMLIALMLYKFEFTRETSARAGVFSSIALFLGFLVPGCASCGIGLAALLGLSASFATLPFKGLELSVLALGILGLSIFRVSNTLFSCKRLNSSEKKKSG